MRNQHLIPRLDILPQVRAERSKDLPALLGFSWRHDVAMVAKELKIMCEVHLAGPSRKSELPRFRGIGFLNTTNAQVTRKEDRT